MIKNITKNKIISKEKKFRMNFFSKSVGLMFSKKDFIPLIFVFEKEKIVPLHMLFVFFQIDVLFLNSEKRVVEIKENFKPFTFYAPKNKAKYIMELPINCIKRNKIRINDKIEF